MSRACPARNLVIAKAHLCSDQVQFLGDNLVIINAEINWG